MIKYDYTVTVTGNTAKLDKDIYLFRGNKNVHYYFAIKNSSEIEMVQNKLIELSDKEIGIQNEEIKNIEDDFEELDEVEK